MFFYNLAWSGDVGLTGGSFSVQMKNALRSAHAVKFAKSVGCDLFVNAGSLEETFLERCLKNKTPFQSSQVNYALAKLASRDMSRMVAYLEKINYIHTRTSAPVSPSLEGGYIASTLKLIKEGRPYERPVNSNLFDIISTNVVADALRLIGCFGKQNSDYFIGTSKPLTLDDFFRKCELFFADKNYQIQSGHFSDKIFEITQLQNDCSYIPPEDPFEFLK